MLGNSGNQRLTLQLYFFLLLKKAHFLWGPPQRFPDCIRTSSFFLALDRALYPQPGGKDQNSATQAAQCMPAPSTKKNSKSLVETTAIICVVVIMRIDRKNTKHYRAGNKINFCSCSNFLWWAGLNLSPRVLFSLLRALDRFISNSKRKEVCIPRARGRERVTPSVSNRPPSAYIYYTAIRSNIYFVLCWLVKHDIYTVP